MENIYLVPPIGPGNTIACLHSAVCTVNDGVLQTVCESVRRVTKRIGIGRGFLTSLVNAYQVILMFSWHP
jgi:hypothetical protein